VGRDDDLEVADPASVHWAADGGSLVLVRRTAGRHEVVRIGVPGELRVLVTATASSARSRAAGEHFFYSVESRCAQRDVGLRRDGSAKRSSATSTPGGANARRSCSRPGQFEVPDGRAARETIEGWLLRQGRERPACRC
jgi:hypothetical protein